MTLNKKIIIFKEDYNGNIPLEKCFIKFLDDENKSAIFYKPLIAPKYLANYIKENNIKEAYIINDDNIVSEYIDKIYTLESYKGIYILNKGVNINKKLILLVDKGMEICLDLPKYSYCFKDNKFYIEEYKENKNKEYCYVANFDDVDEVIKKIMVEVYEIIPGILSLDEYTINKGNSKKKLKN